MIRRVILVVLFLKLQVVDFHELLRVDSDSKLKLLSYSTSVILESIWDGKNTISIFDSVNNFESEDIKQGFLVKIAGQAQIENHQSENMSMISSIIKRKIVLIIMKNFDNFDNKLIQQLKSENFHRQGYYIIVSTNQLMIDDVKQAFKYLWKINLINVVIVFESFGIIKVETYYPFNNKNCNDFTPITINSFVDEKLINESSFFPDKTQNLYGCPLKVKMSTVIPPVIIVTTHQNGSFEYQGRDIEILRFLSEKLNFSTIFEDHIPLPKFNLYENGTATGHWKRLIDNELDILIGDFFLTETRGKY
jgi:hypothetical protein